MKLRSLIFLLLAFITVSAGISQTNPDSLQKPPSSDNQDNGLKEALTVTLQSFDSAKVFPEMLAASNRLGLIAKKWDLEWAAQYFAAYSRIILSFVEKDQKNKDLYLDESEPFIDKAWTLAKSDSSELYVLSAMLSNARLAVMPATRYKKYGDLFNASIEKAKSSNPQNPRAYYLQGTSFYYTPKMFGGGPKNASPYFDKAESLFQVEKSGDILKPSWGRKQNSDMIKLCREAVK